jgi:glycosyltransferase involved in cell wall biosynthesis
MKILFLVPYPLQEAPSQRFRFEQYFEILASQGHTIKTQSFLSSHNWQLFFKTGNPLQKALTLIRGFLKRFFALLIVPSYDFIFIHREAAPIGPPIFEWILTKILRKRIIYDFDDAIWLTDRVQESPLLKILKWRQKIKDICRWSYRVSCGNEYLRSFALQYNSNTINNPTTIDCKNKHNPALYESKKNNDQVVIGWTGSHSTLKYLHAIEPVLQKLENQFPFISFLIIADQPPPIHLERLTFIKWNPQTEIVDLLKMDIGIMPLPDDEWSKGKCGFKALQYMALEIPSVVSPVGVNTSIINHECEGFLCRSNEEWLSALERLIVDKDLRMKLGKAGHKKVIDHYSVSSNTSNFLSLFE